MNYVKTLILLFALLLSSLFSADGVALGTADTPHVVCHAEVWMYSDEGEKLFKIPATYYARINNLDDNFYYVTFNGVAGKLKKGEVSAIGYHTVATGTTVELGISEKYSDFSSIQLKKHPDLGASNVCEIAYGENFSYLGSYPTDGGELWYMVKYKDFSGYVRAERTTEQNIVVPPFEPQLSDTEASASPSEESTEGSIVSDLDSTELKIIIIVGLTLPALAIVILLFKPFKRKYD